MWEAFWFKENAADCFFHTILPTAFSVMQPSWYYLILSSNLDTWSMRERLLCACCKTSTERQRVQLAIRILIIGGSHDSYAILPDYAAICNRCSNHTLPILIHCDASMGTHITHFILEHAFTVATTSKKEQLSGEDLVQRLRNSMTSNHVDLMRALSTANNRACQYCLKNDAQYRCSHCNYFRYCDETCSLAGWDVHKKTCALIQSPSNMFGRLIKPP